MRQLQKYPRQVSNDGRGNVQTILQSTGYSTTTERTEQTSKNNWRHFSTGIPWQRPLPASNLLRGGLSYYDVQTYKDRCTVEKSKAPRPSLFHVSLGKLYPHWALALSAICVPHDNTRSNWTLSDDSIPARSTAVYHDWCFRYEPCSNVGRTQTSVEQKSNTDVWPILRYNATVLQLQVSWF